MARLRDEVRAFLDRHGMSESTFGRLALNDSAFCRRIFREERRADGTMKEPRSPRETTIEEVRIFMELYDRRYGREASHAAVVEAQGGEQAIRASRGGDGAQAQAGE